MTGEFYCHGSFSTQESNVIVIVFPKGGQSSDVTLKFLWEPAPVRRFTVGDEDRNQGWNSYLGTLQYLFPSVL